MTSKAGTALDYGTTTPKHAVKSHGTTTYSYDANGSLTAKGTQTIKYDPEQRPILVQDGSNYSRAAYDGDDVRRKRDDSNGIVHYLGGYERKLAGGSETSDTVTKYYSASLGALSRSVAFRRGGTLHWVGADHLGGTIRVLNSSFTALDGMRYKPYGEDRDTGSSLNTDRKFTGQTEDETAGLYWYASRAYDPAIGRFVSPDPIVPDPFNPQSLNRYGYVYNNPLKFVDPSGRAPGGAEWDQDWVDEFTRNHNGQPPTLRDWEARQYSLRNPGSGPGGSWTDQDWEIYTRNKETSKYVEENIYASFTPPNPPGNPVAPTPEAPPPRSLWNLKGRAKPRPPERYYLVQDENGYEFTVYENVSGLKMLTLVILGAEAGVYVDGQVWARGELPYGASRLYWHEIWHIYQLKEFGQLDYSGGYTVEQGKALWRTGLDSDEAHNIHPFEVAADEYAEYMITLLRQLRVHP